MTGAVVAYLRVSTAGQAADGYGLDVQRQDCQNWAARVGAIIVAEHVDGGLSGKLDAVDRPGLSAALADIGPDVALLVPRLDRLARTLTVQEGCLAVAWQSGATVYAADQGEVPRDDPDDPLRTAVRQILGVIGQLDRSMTVKKLRDGRRFKASQGRHAGGRYPFGTERGGEGKSVDAVPREDEQGTVARILALRAQGASYRAVAARLDTEGHPSRYGGPWQPTAVRKIALRATG